MFFSSSDAKAITDITTRNKRTAELWKSLPEEEHKRYNDMAKERPPQSYNPWKEAKRILENLKHNVISVCVSIPCQIPANCMSISCMYS